MYDRRTRRKVRRAEETRDWSARLTRDFTHADSIMKTTTDLELKVRMQRLMAKINGRAVMVTVEIGQTRGRARALLDKAA